MKMHEFKAKMQKAVNKKADKIYDYDLQIAYKQGFFDYYHSCNMILLNPYKFLQYSKNEQKKYKQGIKFCEEFLNKNEIDNLIIAKENLK